MNIHYKLWFTLSLITLLSSNVWADGFCLTKDGQPTASPVDIFSLAWSELSGPEARYLHSIQAKDYDRDGILDVLLIIDDQTYNGSPVFDIQYYHGTSNGWCGLSVASARAALNDDVSLEVISKKPFPSFRFKYTAIDPVKLLAQPVSELFEYDPSEKRYKPQKQVWPAVNTQEVQKIDIDQKPKD